MVFQGFWAEKCVPKNWTIRKLALATERMREFVELKLAIEQWFQHLNRWRWQWQWLIGAIGFWQNKKIQGSSEISWLYTVEKKFTVYPKNLRLIENFADVLHQKKISVWEVLTSEFIWTPNNSLSVGVHWLSNIKTKHSDPESTLLPPHPFQVSISFF